MFSFIFRCNFIYSCLEIDTNDRPDMEDIIDDLMKNSECLKPCLNAPTTSVVIEDTDEFEIPPSSCQNTVTPSHAQKFQSVLHRRSFHGSMSQEKLNSVSVKRSSGIQGVKTSPNKTTHIKTFIPIVMLRPRSNSVGTPEGYHKDKYNMRLDENSPGSRNRNKEKTKRYSEEILDSSAHTKYVPLLSNNTSYGDQSSDYYTDTSKELYQTVTSL